MMDFLATNFNLPTIIGAVIVFGGTGLIVWHSHKHGGVGCDCGGSCHGECVLSSILATQMPCRSRRSGT